MIRRVKNTPFDMYNHDTIVHISADFCDNLSMVSLLLFQSRILSSTYVVLLALIVMMRISIIL